MSVRGKRTQAAGPHCDYHALERRAEDAINAARVHSDPAEARAGFLEATMLISCAIRAAFDLGDKVTEQRLTRLLVHAHLIKLAG